MIKKKVATLYPVDYLRTTTYNEIKMAKSTIMRMSRSGSEAEQHLT